MVQIKVVENGDELASAFSVRRSVFIQEQDVPEEEEWDEVDKKATHVIAIDDGKVVGTGRLMFYEEEARVERIAVLSEYRKKGIGSQITRFLIERAKEKDPSTISANVQTRALDFYGKLGFVPIGNTFLDAGIEHIKTVLEQDR